MAIGWSTAAILVVLLPGFVFIAGLLSTERISRDTTPRSSIAQLAGIVFVSFFLHALLLSLFGLEHSFRFWPTPDLALVFSALFGGIESSGEIRNLAENVSRNLRWIAAYEALICVLAFGVGRRLGSFALGNPAGRLGRPRRWLSFLVEHRWAYDLFPDPAKGFAPTYAHVLTKTGKENAFLLYSGPLHRCGLRPDGRFAYFILQAADCRTLAPEKGSVNLSIRSPVLSAQFVGMTLDYRHEFLYIDCEEVANVFIHRYPLKAVENLGKLRDEIESAKREDSKAPVE